MTRFISQAHVLKYIQDYSNTCYFSILASVIFASGQYVAQHAIASRTMESLVFESKEYAYITRFYDNIMIDK